HRAVDIRERIEEVERGVRGRQRRAERELARIPDLRLLVADPVLPDESFEVGRHDAGRERQRRREVLAALDDHRVESAARLPRRPHGSLDALYPSPRTVTITVGFAGSVSIFARSRRTWTSTSRESPR